MPCFCTNVREAIVCTNYRPDHRQQLLVTHETPNRDKAYPLESIDQSLFASEDGFRKILRGVQLGDELAS